MSEQSTGGGGSNGGGGGWRLALHWQILLALVLGALAGVGINQLWTPGAWAAVGVNDSASFLTGRVPASAPAGTTAASLNPGAGIVAGALRFGVLLTDFVGDLFLQCLRFIAVPIVLFSLIGAVAGLGDPRRLGRMGGKTIALFLATGLTSATLGVSLAWALAPGTVVTETARANLPGADLARAEQAARSATDLSAWRMLLEAVPTNPFAAIAQGQMLQIVVLSIILGLGLTLIEPGKARPVIAFCEGLGEAVLRLVRLLMFAAPYAVFCLVVVIVAGLGLSVFKALALYCVVVLVGLGLVLFVLYPLLTTFLTPAANRVGYRRFFRAMAPAQLVAFTTSSSAATLPVTMECCRDRLGAAEDVTSFVCSLGVSFNMDGTALYQAIAVTFLAQLYGVPMTFADLLTVALMAAALSIGVPGIPGGSLVIMAVVLDTIGVPPQGIAIILAVDRVLDMSRTVINISGDAMGTAIIAASEGKLKTEAQLAAGASAGA